MSQEPKTNQILVWNGTESVWTDPHDIIQQVTDKLQIYNHPTENSQISFMSNGGEQLARIDEGGIFRVTVDPTDENTNKFIDMVNEHLLRDQHLLRAIESLP